MSPDALAGLPHRPGVYLFYGEDDALLYVGKSVDLHDRVLSHLSGDHRSHTASSIAHRLTRIDGQETAGELGALLREAELIKRLRPLHNRRLRAADPPVVAFNRDHYRLLLRWLAAHGDRVRPLGA